MATETAPGTCPDPGVFEVEPGALRRVATGMTEAAAGYQSLADGGVAADLLLMSTTSLGAVPASDELRGQLRRWEASTRAELLRLRGEADDVAEALHCARDGYVRQDDEATAAYRRLTAAAGLRPGPA